MFAMATHVVFKFFWCFASVSDVCCKCFNYFGRILQMFPLDVTKVDLVLHMLQWDPSAAGISRLVQLLGLPACAWVWRDASGIPRGRRSRWSGAGHGAGVGHNGVGPHVKQRRHATWESGR
jgi:hypothetical protein